MLLFQSLSLVFKLVICFVFPSASILYFMPCDIHKLKHVFACRIVCVWTLKWGLKACQPCVVQHSCALWACQAPEESLELLEQAFSISNRIDGEARCFRNRIAQCDILAVPQLGSCCQVLQHKLKLINNSTLQLKAGIV